MLAFKPSFADQLSAELNYGLQIDCPLSSMVLTERNSVFAKAYAKVQKFTFELPLTRLVAEPGSATLMI